MDKINPGDTAWLLFSAALVLLMTPGLALFYGGMVRAKNVLGTIMHSLTILALITGQWVLIGYSLSFGPDWGGIIGDFSWVGLKGVGLEPYPDYVRSVPHQTFMIYQAMFAIITPPLITGAIAERIKFKTLVLFAILWSTLVYDPIAHWVWGVKGWMREMGALDFAGGAVVHINSGASALAAALLVGKRKNYGQEPIPPHNLPMTITGTAILWFGWFGFNAGSALAANQLSTTAFVATHIAAAGACLSWLNMEWLLKGKPTTLGAASRAVAGLVAITPASGFVGPISALVIGLSAGVFCYLAVLIKNKLGYDDSLDVVGIHGLGGTWGALATGLFASLEVNSAGHNGLFFGNAGLLARQAITVIVTWIYAFGVTFILLKILHKVMGLRVKEEEEEEGLDLSQHNEKGYTIKTPKESLRSAQKDFDLFLSFLDARWVAGAKALFYEWEKELERAMVKGKEREWILKIKERVEERHRRHGDSVFILEPELKEGKGGLRDYHSALLATKIKYRLHTPQELPEKGLLSEKDWRNLSTALDFLWRVRNQLHYLHGRKEDRLSFEDQETLANLLGYNAVGAWRATENFLRDYFRHALRIQQISGNLIEKCLWEEPRQLINWGGRSAEISPGLTLYHGKLISTDPARFDRSPLEIWQAWAAVHRYGVEMDSRLKEIISAHLDVVGEKFRLAEESVNYFWSFFEKPGNLALVLETMQETGFLQKFLPEFEKIYCHVQYDRYHIYPIDVHSIYAVKELENLEKKKSSEFFPLLSQLMEEVRDRGILKLAALIHDLGKVAGASHSQYGEEIAAIIGKRLRLSPERIATLRFLVREHLTLAETAQRRDLNEENMIQRFAHKVGDIEKLRLLYLLSFADLRAVGPSSWTSWKDTLMRELFFKTGHYLKKGKGFAQHDQEQMIQKQREIMDLLNGHILPWKIAEYLANIPLRHYSLYESQDIAQQIIMAEKLSEEVVLAAGEEKSSAGGEKIITVARDEPGLFAKICGVMTANYLNILAAQVSTWDKGIAVDQFWVQNLIGESLIPNPRWGKLQQNLKDVLSAKIKVEELLAKISFPLAAKSFFARSRARVEIDNESSDFYTIVEIYAMDYLGLLYQIAKKFFNLGLNIRSAKISTKVDQVVDVFYIQDLSGAKIEEGELLLKIKEEILAELER